MTASDALRALLGFEHLAPSLIGIAAALFLLAWLSRKKRFYFIRHGRTLLNEAHVKQGAEGGLSDAGKAQAEKVGAALRGARISLIVSSTYERAKETSALIATELACPIAYTELLAERKNPSSVVGKPVDDPSVKEAMGHTAYGYHEDEYRYADEENFTDLKARARACLTDLAKRPGSAVACVTHHAFLHMLLSYMLYGEKLHATDFTKLSFFNPAENGGLTICEYAPLARLFGSTGWTVLAYNEEVA